MVAHGAQKLFTFGHAGIAQGFGQMGMPLPQVAAAVIIAVEFLGGLMMLAIGTARGEWSLLTFEARAWWAELYLIVAGSLVGYTAYIFALKHLPISTVSLYAYVNPVIAVLIGVWLANEAFGWRVVVAGALVMGGVTVVRSRAT